MIYGAMPPRSTAVGVKELLLWSLLSTVVFGALQQQPSPNHNNNARSFRRSSNAALNSDTALNGQRGLRDTYVEGSGNSKLRTSLTPERALATFSPAENDAFAAGKAPPAYKPSASTSAGGLSRQPARSLQDWQVEDIILLATVDGMVHARDRKTGQAKWAIEMDRPMVETVYHRHNKSVDEFGEVREDPLWIVEPSQDGSIYIYAPSSGLGMQKLGMTVKELAEQSPYEGDGINGVAYTAEKRSFSYHINAADGNVIKSFSPTGSTVNDESRCRRVNPLDPLDEEDCVTESIGILVLGRTEYTIGIQDRNTGEQISTIKYFEWVPNNRNQDLRSQYTTTLDKKYVYTKYDGRIFGMDLASHDNYNPNPITKAIYRQKLSSPVARIFDIVRPHGSPSDADLVLLPQPVSPTPDNLLDPNTPELVWVNCTEDGSWYALSEGKYPIVTEGAPSAMYSNDDIMLNPPPLSIPMSKQDRKNFMGVHQISSLGGYQGPGLIEQPNIPHIDPPPPEEHGAVIEPPPSVWDNMPSIRALLTALMFALMACGVLYQQQGGNLLKKKVTFDTPSQATEVAPAPHEKASEPAPMIREAEPAEEIIFPRKNPDEAPEAIKDDDSFELINENDAGEPPGSLAGDQAAEHAAGQVGEPEGPKEGEEAKPTKKKATRGKRGGKKQKEKDAQKAEARGQRANSNSQGATQVAPAVPTSSAVITVAASENPQISGPLQINNLIIHTDKIIGRGSGGTCVFEGTFDGQHVAVKRMLSEYYHLASQEVAFLQQNEDHKHVIHYRCMQKDDHFLYIAVELCQASLFDVWDAEKARPESRQLQLSKLKVAIQQDVTNILLQLADGVHYLHDQRIIHRDIKPQNILVAFPKGKNDKPITLKISDFGLGKNLPDNVSTLVDPTGNAGTSGWKAPELISQPSDTASRHSSTTGERASENAGGTTSGVKRAADIFSLGCLFFWVLTDGIHPFEDENGWQQLRELNIKNDKKKMDVLTRWSDAYEPMQLITSMLQHAPEDRPTALQVRMHPFFWSATRRLAFLCDVSDHFEREPRGVWEDDFLGDSYHLSILEERAEEVIGAPFDFLSKLDRAFVDTLGRQRKYSGNRLLDLLRALRNKKNHYEDMPVDVQKRVGTLVGGGYLAYWCQRFPRLLIACYEVVYECGLEGSDRFGQYFHLGKE